MDKFDVIVVGGGPCGLSACVYACRSGLKTLLLETFACGGQMLNSHEVKNYPGFSSVSGVELAQQMLLQAQQLGVQIGYERVVDIQSHGTQKVVKTAKHSYVAGAVILALGAKPKKLGIDREEYFTGKGVSYCAICDGHFFKDKTVAVVGGGNSAIEDVPYLANLAKKVYLINRSKKYRAQAVLLDNVMELVKSDKVQIIENSVVTQLDGNDKLESVITKNLLTNAEQKLSVDGLFVEIGRSPDTEFLRGKLDLDEYGYILVGDDYMTSIEGVFAGGDAIKKSLRQIVTATSDGAICATNAYNYLCNHEK